MTVRFDPAKVDLLRVELVDVPGDAGAVVELVGDLEDLFSE